jgi:hypothetical protein
MISKEFLPTDAKNLLMYKAFWLVDRLLTGFKIKISNKDKGGRV